MLFIDFGGSSLDFELRFWIKDIEDNMEMLTKVRLAIDKVFREQNIEIPFPQTDVHIKNSGLEIPQTDVHTKNSGLEIPQTDVHTKNSDLETPQTDVHTKNSGLEVQA